MRIARRISKKEILDKELHEHEYEDPEEFVKREDVWFFNAYFTEIAAGLFDEFMEIAEISETSKGYMEYDVYPVKAIGRKQFNEIKDALGFLVEYFKQITDRCSYNGVEYKFSDIDFVRGETIVPILNALHLFVNILPYLNSRHYVLSQERYEEERYHKFAFEELQNLDRTLAKIILPTFTWFAEHSISSPMQFHRLYTFPKPRGHNSGEYDCWEQWIEALCKMVNAWEWIRDRDSFTSCNLWESVPDEIYYGLHLFAEFLLELQND